MKIEMFDDSTFALPSRHSNEFDVLPAFADVLPAFADSGDLCIQNCQLFSLSREVSRSFSRSDSFKDIFDIPSLSREASKTVIGNIVVLGREDSMGLLMTRETGFHDDSNDLLIMTRENSGFLGSLARDLSTDLSKLCESSSTHFESRFPEGEIIVDGHDLMEPRRSTDGVASQKRSAARPRGEPRQSRRGAHVKARPDMQQTARDGAAHWGARVKALRAAWGERAAQRPPFAAEYAAQAAAARGRIKAKQECLLRFLQLAADDGLVSPGPFGPGGFFGWGRFAVAAGRGAEFRRALEGLFPAGFREDTLKETFRRAGLIPEGFQWEQAWRGGVAFEFRPRDSDAA